MQYRVLGKTGLRVSAVGLGGIPIQRVSAQEVQPLLQLLAHEGVNFIDTARGYTVSESYLGEALEATGLRGKFILATKSMARSYADMQRDIETSLANLRTDCIDLYQLHNVAKDADFELAFSDAGAIAALREAVQAGKIKHIGATAHSVKSFERLLTYPDIETIMFPYNIVENQGEALMERCTQQGVGFIAMKPLAGGNIENGTLALRYILQNPHCTLAIPGMAEEQEALQNIAAAQTDAPLSASEQAEIETIRAALTGDFCRRCGYCAPCTAGIDIPSAFLLHGYLARYDLATWAQQRYAGLAVKADACVACGTCETRCPYNLPIIEKLRRVATDFAAT